MKIILLKDVTKVGRKYDIKDVAEGFALNMLIPKGLAQVATKDIIAKAEVLRANDLTNKKIQEDLLLKNFETLKNLKINLKEKANDKGHLFAGITAERLAEEVMKATKLNLPIESIKLGKHVKEVGESKITVEILGKKTEFILNIEAE